MKKELQDKIINDFPKLFKCRDTQYEFYFETENGWYNLIYTACKELQEWSDTTTAQITIRQIKEKFGAIRIYTNVDNDKDLDIDTSEITAIVDRAEDLSTQTCEKCGSMENVERTNFGWIKHLCTVCKTKRAVAKNAHEFWSAT